MNQRKYILLAILILFTGAGLFFIIRKISQTKTDENSLDRGIDFIDPVDSLSGYKRDGKMLFMNKCASCHAVSKNIAGPALMGVKERGPWIDTLKLYQYIREPELFKKSKYVDSLRKVYGFNHMGFPDLTNEEIKAILRYITQWEKPVVDIVE